MKKTHLLVMLSVLMLGGCGKQQAYEKQPFPELPKSVSMSSDVADPNLLPVIEGEVLPPVDGIPRPPRGPIGTLEERHPELFE